MLVVLRSKISLLVVAAALRVDIKPYLKHCKGANGMFVIV